MSQFGALKTAIRFLIYPKSQIDITKDNLNNREGKIQYAAEAKYNFKRTTEGVR